jgi:hypothetical protein
MVLFHNLVLQISYLRLHLLHPDLISIILVALLDKFSLYRIIITDQILINGEYIIPFDFDHMCSLFLFIVFLLQINVQSFIDLELI